MRFKLLFALPLCGSLAIHAAEVATPAPDFHVALKTQLEASRDSRRGLVFYVAGQSIAGVVKQIGPDAVIVVNQEHGRVLINIDRIDAVAGN